MKAEGSEDPMKIETICNENVSFFKCNAFETSVMYQIKSINHVIVIYISANFMRNMHLSMTFYTIHSSIFYVLLNRNLTKCL